MALDIIAGDYLVISSTEYPIRAVEHWDTHGFGTSKSYALYATVACSTKRSPAISSGKRGKPANNLTSIYCTPLDRVDADTVAQLKTEVPFYTRQTFISDGTDYARLIVDHRRL